MNQLSERLLVAAPLASAGRFLGAYMAANRTQHGDGSHILLQARGLQQPAISVLAAEHRPAGVPPRYDLLWTAEGLGIFPVFKGQLSVMSGEGDHAFWLVISGSYAPPGGIVGTTFDLVAGNRLAAATARNLLEQIRGAIQRCFADEEWAKEVSA